MLLLILITTLLVSGAGCQNAAHSPARAAGDKIPADAVITLERTVCYGTCPSYVITVRGDGRLVYAGREFVKVKGTVEGTVTPEQLKELVAEFEKADYFSLRDSYSTEQDGCRTVWTDNPSALTSIQLGDRKKAVAHYHGCEGKDKTPDSPLRRLSVLERRIDEIVGSARWVKGEGDTPQP